MGIIDWIILLFLLCFIVQGWRRGLAGMIIRGGGIVASFFLIGHFFPLVKTSLLANYKMGVVLATIIALLLIIVLMVVLIRLVMYFLQLLLKSARLTTANKFLGMGLGFLNGLLVVIVFTMMMDYIPSLSTPLKVGSKHRVYAAVDTLKTDLVNTIKLKQYDRYLKIMDKMKADKKAQEEQSGKSK